MSEYEKYTSRQDFSEKREIVDEDMEKIDLFQMVEVFWDGFKRYGWIAVILAIVFGVKASTTVTTTYIPPITVSATVTVNDNSGNMGTTTAYEMASLFSYIQSSGILGEAVKEDLNVTSLNGSISVEHVEDTNFVIIRVTSMDGEAAWDILHSVIRVYPEASLYILGPVNLRVIDEPERPEIPDSITTTTRGSWKRGAMKGAIIGLGIVAVLSLLRRTIRSKEDISKHFNVRYIGSIPFIRQMQYRAGNRRNLSILNENASYELRESVRKIRTRVTRYMEEHESQVILVTSSIPGEGKTTMSTNLAISIAQKGKRVLLVDCDLRHPSVENALYESIPGKRRKSKVKRIEKKPKKKRKPVARKGLDLVLRGEIALTDAIFCPNKKVPTLQVICGGKGCDDAFELLASVNMEEAVEQMKELADVIILDTAPAAMLADASAIARYVDGALYVMKYNFARIHHIVEGIENLTDSGIEILGCVLNGVKYSTEARYSKSESYGYGYGRYGYGYGSGSDRYRKDVEKEEDNDGEV